MSSNPKILLKTQPMAIHLTRFPDEGTGERCLVHKQTTLVRHFSNLMSSGKVPTPHFAHSLICFPEALRQIPEQWVDTSPVVKNAVLSDPDALLYYLTSHYESIASKYEDRLLGAGMGQYIHGLLDWANRDKVAPRQPLEYYLQFLERDPYWAMRVHREIVSSPEMIRDMHEKCLAEHEKHAPGALYYLLNTPSASADRYMHLFNENMEYAYLARILLFDRGFTAANINTDLLTPRWAYHFLMAGSRIPEDACYAALVRHPGWLVEFLEDEGLSDENFERTVELYLECSRRAPPHPLMESLHAYIGRLRSQIEKANSEVGASAESS